MNKKLALLWPLSLAATFYLGYNFQAQQPSQNLEQASEQASTANDSEQNEFFASTAGDNLATNHQAEGQSPAATPSSNSNNSQLNMRATLTELKALVSSGMDMEAIAKAYNQVNSFSQSEVEQALARLENNANQRDNLTLLSLLLSKYAQENPHAALSYVEQNLSSLQSKSRLTARVVAAWAKTDANAAYNWFVNEEQAKTLPRLSSRVLPSVFTELAKQDFDNAFSKLTELAENPAEQRSAVYGIARSFTSEAEFAGLMEKTSDFSDRRAKEAVVSAWVRRDPYEAIDWIESVGDNEEKAKLQEKLLSSWLYAEPKVAADWYLNNAQENEKQQYADKIISKWAYRDPATALDWIDQQTGIDQQKSTAKLLDSSAYRNTDFVMNNLNLLSDDKDLVKVSSKVYHTLVRNNPSKAAEFVAQSPVKDALQKKIDSYNKYLAKKAKGK